MIGLGSAKKCRAGDSTNHRFTLPPLVKCLILIARDPKFVSASQSPVSLRPLVRGAMIFGRQISAARAAFADTQIDPQFSSVAFLIRQSGGISGAKGFSGKKTLDKAQIAASIRSHDPSSIRPPSTGPLRSLPASLKERRCASSYG